MNDPLLFLAGPCRILGQQVSSFESILEQETRRAMTKQIPNIWLDRVRPLFPAILPRQTSLVTRPTRGTMDRLLRVFL